MVSALLLSTGPGRRKCLNRCKWSQTKVEFPATKNWVTVFNKSSHSLGFDPGSQPESRIARAPLRVAPSRDRRWSRSGRRSLEALCVHTPPLSKLVSYRARHGNSDASHFKTVPRAVTGVENRRVTPPCPPASANPAQSPHRAGAVTACCFAASTASRRRRGLTGCRIAANRIVQCHSAEGLQQLA